MQSKSRKSVNSLYIMQTPSYSAKKGLVFGAIGGFVSSICFAGLLLLMSVLLGYPEGTFFNAFGTIFYPLSLHIVSTGLIAFMVILAQGIIIGIIFGVLVSKIKGFNPVNKRKGLAEGMILGLVVFLVIYLPFFYFTNAYQNLISETLSNLSDSTFLSTRGGYNVEQDSSIINTSGFNVPLWIMLSYVVCGILTGGILTLSYSVYNYDLKEIKQSQQASWSNKKL